MATLTAQQIVRTGLKPTMASAASGGDEFPNTGKEWLYFKNGEAGEITVTLDIETTVDGQPVTDPTVAIPAGEQKFIGPFPPAIYNNSTTGRVSVTYSAVTSLTVAVMKL